MLEIVQAIVLGIVQGLTEFIPVSSSAHLIIVPWLLEPLTGIGDFGLSFDLALHLGTLVAVLVYFRDDWLRYLGAGIASLRERRLAGDHDRLLGWLLVVGCIPGALAGMFLDSFVESFFHQPGSAHQSSAMLVLAGMIVALAVLLWLAERMARHVRPFSEIGWRDAILIGLAQAAAVLPGVSRSGSTITMGLFLGLQREAAARFSFLLAAPIIAGAGAKKMFDAVQEGLGASELAIFVAGFISALVVGYLCIRFLLGYLKSNSTMVFAAYRVVLGIVIVVLVLAGFGQ